MDEFVNLRRELHANPELSGDEWQTASRIESLFRQFDPDETITRLGGNGLAFVFGSQDAGPAVLFRCELDAIPVNEEDHAAQPSQNPGVSHNCGHDGHMAIMAHFGYQLSQNRPIRGRIILLFQPAEETGQGAKAVFDDPRFKALKADFAFALHNLPGYPLGSIVVKPGPMNYASCGMTVRLTGVTSHAAWPEEGISPALPMANIIRGLADLSSGLGLEEIDNRVTVVHARLGEPAFGVSPGFAEIRTTLRAETDDALQALVKRATRLVKQEAMSANLGCEIDRSEEFMASLNDSGACEIVKKAAGAAGLNIIDLDRAMRVSEDFGQLSARMPGVMFGLGAGENCPGLHRPDYNFPEALIQTGSTLFMEIVRQFHPDLTLSD